jgi:hypothetical protein
MGVAEAASHRVDVPVALTRRSGLESRLEQKLEAGCPGWKTRTRPVRRCTPNVAGDILLPYESPQEIENVAAHQ